MKAVEKFKRQESETDRYSKGTYLSISFGNLITEFFIVAFGSRVFDFYENEIGLQSKWISGAIILYALWNMFNDPIIGYISDKPRKWWKKYGKRRPWILGAIIPIGISLVLIFAVPPFDPEQGAIWLTLWLLISSIIYDTCFSIFGTNFMGLLPEKFRSDKERRRQATIGISFSTVGMVLGTMLPSIIGDYNNQATWLLGAGITSIVGIGFGMLMWWGTIEPPEMIDRTEHCVDEIIHEKEEVREEEKYPLFSTLKTAFKDKNYMSYLILIVCYQCLTLMMVGSIPYLNRFIITVDGVQSPIKEYLLFLPAVVVGLLSIPAVNWLTRKIGSPKMVILGGILIICSGIPFLFISNYIVVMSCIAIMAVAQITFGLQLQPILGDVMDELVAKIGKRQEGLITGIRTFFARMGLIIQALTFWIIHELTGFTPGGETQDALASLGLRFQLALVPTIIMGIGIFLFWRLYDIDAKKKSMIRGALSKMKL